jgi:hypothetical protein
LQTIRNFFAFRPAFTRFGLKALWYAFLIEFIFRFGNLIFGTLHLGGNSPGVWYSLLLIVAPEVAAHLLLGKRAR